MVLGKAMMGIIGYGWVGRAMHELFTDAIIYDPILGMGSKDEINLCDITFICVPTPNLPDGSLDTSIVEETVDWCESPLIVIRSTVNPGTTKRLSTKYEKRIVFQPEYLGESPAHPMNDQSSRQFVVLGGAPKDRRAVIECYTGVYNANVTIRQMGATEAEFVKLTENRAVSFKVAQCQELYDVCEASGLDYYAIRDVVYGEDPRFDLWFSFIYPDERGMNSKCIPKDVYAWCAFAESVGYEPKITSAILEKNKDWVARA